MPLDFPSNPTNGQVYDNFVYSSAKGTWKSLSSGASPNYLVNPTITDAVITATADTPSTIPLTVNGAASQSANLQEWKNSAGIQLANIDASGNIKASRIGLGGSAPPSAASGISLQMTGRGKVISDGSQSAGIWLTGSSGVDTAFIGATSPTTTDPIGVYHNGAWRWQVNNAGQVTMPYQPAFSAYASASNIAANQTMPYNNAVINRGGHYNISTYRFTAPVAGIYLFSVYDIGQTSGTTRFSLYRNGASTEDSLTHQLRGSNGANFTSATSFWTISANAGDYFSVYIYETGSYGTIEYSWFQGFLIG